MTIFRDSFTGTVAARFGLLLSIKALHWLVQDRIDYIEQAMEAALTAKFHARVIGALVTSLALDGGLAYVAVQSIIDTGPSMQLLFAFEYIVLLAMAFTSTLKYVIQCIDRTRHQGQWETKAVYMFYVDFVMDFVKLVACAPARTPGRAPPAHGPRAPPATRVSSSSSPTTLACRCTSCVTCWGPSSPSPSASPT